MPYKHMKGIHHIDTGQGIPVVFQHGLAANSSQIKNLLEDVRGIRLLSMDCPGHSNSIILENKNVSFSHYADLLLELIDDKGIDRFIIGGLSMGAGIALRIAIQYPERVKGLVLHRPAWTDIPATDNLGLLLRAIPFMKRKEGLADFKILKEMQELDESLPAAANSVLGIFGAHQQDTLYETIEAMVMDTPIHSLSVLNEIQCPCLILGNEDDPLHPLSIAETLHTHIEDSELRRLTSRYIDQKLHKSMFTTYLTDFIEKTN